MVIETTVEVVVEETIVDLSVSFTPCRPSWIVNRRMMS